MRTLLTLIGIAVISSMPATAKEQPRAQIFGGYSYMNGTQEFFVFESSAGSSETESNGSMHRNGWNISLAINLTGNLAFVADASNHFQSDGGREITVVRYQRADFGYGIKLKPKYTAYSFLFGPRIRFLGEKKFSPFGHVLLGISKVDTRLTGYYGTVGISPIISPIGSIDNTFSDTGFASAVGGGLDWQCSKLISIRLLQADYVWTRKDEFTYDPTYFDHNPWVRGSMSPSYRISSGIIFNIGKMQD